MEGISFFHSRGGSGYIRGVQMAKYLGAKDNPTGGYENDLCIYTKILPPEVHPENVWADVDDSFKQYWFLRTHPEFKVIAISETAKDFLSEALNRDDIVCIPHQHCNFERRVRPPREVKVVGIIGTETSFQFPKDEFRKMLEPLGLELRYDQDYWNTYKTNHHQEMRLNVADFYYEMDVQVVWRPSHRFPSLLPFANPNKMGNSASFGIPTIAFPEKSYVREFEGCFLPAGSIAEMVDWLRRLKNDPLLYYSLSKKNLERSEFYHIDNISKLYKNLK